MTEEELFLMEVPELATQETFRANSHERVAWVLRKIAEQDERIRDVKDWAKKEEAQAIRVKEWFTERFKPDLIKYVQDTAGGNKKSVRLPGGTIGFRKTPLKLDIEDEEALKSWAVKNARESVRYSVEVSSRSSVEEVLEQLEAMAGDKGEYKVKESVRKEVINKHFKETGEVPEGTVVVEPEDRFFIDTKKEKK